MKTKVSLIPYLVLPLLLALVVACAQNTPEAIFNRGMQDFESGNFVTASIHFDDFVTKFPDNERTLGAYVMLSRCHMELRDFISARRVYEEIQERYPADAIILQCSSGIGQAYMLEGNYDAAEQVFQGVIDAATTTQTIVEGYSSLADVKSRQQQTEEAVNYMEQIIEYADEEIEDPTETVNLKFFALENSAQILMASGEFDQARNRFATALRLAEDATGVVGAFDMRQRAVVNWAHTWVQAGDFVSAATTYDRLLNNRHVTEEIKPQLVVWKIQSLERLFQQDDGEFSDDERAVLAHEHGRFIEEYDNTQYGTNARIQIAGLILDSTPERANQLLDEAIVRLEGIIAEPPSPDAALNAMMSIVQANMVGQRWEAADQAAQQLRITYSDIPQVVQAANNMVQAIEQQRAMSEAPSAPPEEESP